MLEVLERKVPMKFLQILLSLAATAAWGQATISLKVLSSAVDPESHRVVIDVANQSSKVVTAYTLTIRQLDGSNKEIAAPQNIGVDLLAYHLEGADSSQSNEIQPGASAVFPIGVVSFPDAASAQASVTGVVYSDRTKEGNGSLLFVGRANDAKEARAALALMSPYPATPDALRTVIEKLRSMPHGIGLGALASGIHLPGDAAGALFDKEQPVPPIGLPTAQQWDSIAGELRARATFWEAQSQEVRP
jgi:hypothetical protein